MTGFIECIEVGKIYHGRTGDVEALRGISIACAAGEFAGLLGLSGCGKSTLLQMIAGLETPSTGQIIVDGRELNGPSRSTSIVFQDHGLFPWLTAEENVEFPLALRRVAKDERRAKAQDALKLVGLDGFGKRR